MIIYAMYRKKATVDEITWIRTDGKSAVRLDPEDMPTDLIDTIEAAKGGADIFIDQASILYLDIIKTLVAGGYNYLKGNPKAKDMHDRDFKALIGVSGGIDYRKTFYSVTIRRHKKRTTLYCVQNYIRLRDIWEVLDVYRQEDSPEGYAAALFIALKGLLHDFESTSTAYPYTIGSIAKKEWTKKAGFWYIKNTMLNANIIKIEGRKKETTIEKFCRPAYHGGFCDYSDKAAGEVGPGIVIDANSMYPHVMTSCPMPYGKPKYFLGAIPSWVERGYKRQMKFFYVKIKTRFKLKPDGVPCVTAKGQRLSTLYEDGWLTTSDYYDRTRMEYHANDKGLQLTLAAPDYYLFLSNYNIISIEYIEGVWFLATKGIFRDYMLEQYAIKEAAPTKEAAAIPKSKITSLSGKMATYPDCYNLRFDIHGLDIHEDRIKSEKSPASYVQVGAAITAWARAYLIAVIRENRDRWIYSDTDSAHLTGQEPPRGVVIGSAMGQWKIERRFNKAIYFRKKLYILDCDDGAKATLAGIPKATQKWCEAALDSGRDGFVAVSGEDWTEHAPYMPWEQPEPDDDDGWEIYKQQQAEEALAEKIGKDMRELYYAHIPTWIDIHRNPYEVKKIKGRLNLSSYMQGVL